MWKRISTVCLIIISIILAGSSICTGREGGKKTLQPAFHTNVPYLAPELDVKPVIPRWPKRLVEMYDTISIIFIGDVMQHGYQIRSAHIKGMDKDNPDSYNYSHTFKYLKERFSEADLTVANMEFPVGVPPFTGYPQFSAPESIVTEAVESGIDLFQIANNHILDKGTKGLERTLAIYDSLGVHYTGAYQCDSLEKLHNPK
ncbi:MAG: CapA family protein, partial [Bacteroidales bacterium]|nr:CapA family protein [Bacteroidales bacterium]